jgi:ribonuclease R
MLSANVAAAHFLEDHDLVGLYRIHERPRDEKINDLREFLGEFGLGLGGGDEPTTTDYQALLQQAQKRKEVRLIQTVMLRSMMQAVYSPENKGHFGLNYEAYAHFTSPIRRYPDLLVHRAIRSVIRSKKKTIHVQRAKDATLLAEKDIYPYTEAAMASHGENCSMTERRADEATREVTSWLKCEYIQDRVGDTFDGVINAVTGFGLFVELKDIYVEGLVHVTSLVNDYYHFDAARHRLVGEHTGTAYRLGDPLRVKVMRVDLETRKIDFELADLQVGKKHKKTTSTPLVKEEKTFGRYNKPVGLRGSKQGQPVKETFSHNASKEHKEKETAKKKKPHHKKAKQGAKTTHTAEAPSFNIRKRNPDSKK